MSHPIANALDAWVKAGEIGARWYRARAQVERLQKERNGILCVNERMVDDPEGWSYRDGESCWKVVNSGPEGESYPRVDPADWCANCRRRGDVHAKFRKARDLARSLKGALTRACSKAMTAEDALGGRP